MARAPRREVANHDDIMAELVKLKKDSGARFDGIDRRLDAGNRRFKGMEEAAAKQALAVQPLSDLIEAMGGEEQFKELAIDAARGLTALAWLGGKVARAMKWVTVVALGVGAIVAAIKFILLDMWRIP